MTCRRPRPCPLLEEEHREGERYYAGRADGSSRRPRRRYGGLTARAGAALLAGVPDRVGLTAALGELRSRRGRHEPDRK